MFCGFKSIKLMFVYLVDIYICKCNIQSTQKQPSCKKGAAHAKRQHEKVVKSKVVAQKWL